MPKFRDDYSNSAHEEKQIRDAEEQNKGGWFGGWRSSVWHYTRTTAIPASRLRSRLVYSSRLVGSLLGTYYCYYCWLSRCSRDPMQEIVLSTLSSAFCLLRRVVKTRKCKRQEERRKRNEKAGSRHIRHLYTHTLYAYTFRIIYCKVFIYTGLYHVICCALKFSMVFTVEFHTYT